MITAVCLSVTVLLWMPLLRAQPVANIQYPFGQGQELFTPEKPWKYVLTASGSVTLSSATTDLTGTDLSWGTFVVSATNITATNGLIDVWDELGYGVNAVTLAFFTVDDADGDNFDIDLYAWAGADQTASLYGPAMPVYLTTGDACVVGTYDCVKLPSIGTAQSGGLWVDTIAGTDRWPTGVTITDSGSNGICTMTFDLMGCRYLYVRLWNGSTGGTEAANIGMIMRGY